MINIHSVATKYGGSLEAGPHLVCLLAEAADFPSLQYIRPALGPIWPFIQWMLWIPLKHSSSCCMSLITHLCFLLRLQISAAVTVLPLYVFMVYTGTSLPFAIVFEEWLQYLHGHNSVPQKMRAVWSHGTVLLFCSTVLCQNTEYLNISFKYGSLDFYACWFSFCVMLIYCHWLWPFYLL